MRYFIFGKKRKVPEFFAAFTEMTGESAHNYYCTIFPESFKILTIKMANIITTI